MHFLLQCACFNQCVLHAASSWSVEEVLGEAGPPSWIKATLVMTCMEMMKQMLMTSSSQHGWGRLW